MKKEKQSIVGFDFQEVPLEEAQNLAIAGNGKYSDINMALMERLPKLDAGKAFAFGLPDEKGMDVKQCKALAKAVSDTLDQANISWRVIYSVPKKLFVCVPLEVKSNQSSPPSPARKVRAPDTPENLVALAALAEKTFHVDVRNKNNSYRARAARRAVMEIAHKDFQVSGPELSRFFSVTHSTPYYVMHHGILGKKETRILRERVKEEL